MVTDMISKNPVSQQSAVAQEVECYNVDLRVSRDVWVPRISGQEHSVTH